MSNCLKLQQQLSCHTAVYLVKVEQHKFLIIESGSFEGVVFACVPLTSFSTTATMKGEEVAVYPWLVSF